jgi:mannose-6-phosphate isomerase class I
VKALWPFSFGGSMLVRVGEFEKKDGQSRKMKFLKITDLSEEQKNKIGLTPDKESKKKKLAEGSEMVYDVEARDFRVFNWATTTAEVVQEEMEFEL